jgi:alpha-mannosidase
MPRRHWVAAFLILISSLGSGAAWSQAEPKKSLLSPPFASGPTIHIISSSHQDIAWMNSPEACIEFRDTHCITPALEMMAKNPDYCFVMENMLNLVEYLERHPERRDEIYRFTREGRLEWGATFNQPYESFLSGEQLIRQTYFGRRWLKKHFPGCDARVYFNPDVPGRSLQMQQILAKAGIPFMIVSRYHKGYYRWASPDGSSVVAYSPGHYTNASSILTAAPAEAVRALEDSLAEWNAEYSQRRLPLEFPLLYSVDFSKPTDFGPLINAWNSRHLSAEGSPLSRMAYSPARRFLEALTQPDADFKTVMGERPNLWLYIHGPTHHWAITAQREAGVLLPAAEIFSTISALLEGSFNNYPAAELTEAWQAAIYPDHGWGGKEGQVTDRLFRKKYEFARDEGRKKLQNALLSIASRAKTDSSRGIPVVVFNGLSWRRSDPVSVFLDTPPRPWRVQDTAGQTMTSQALSYPALCKAGKIRLEFIAGDVPALGYKTFYLTEANEFPPDPNTPIPPADHYENEFYRIELAPGGVKRIYDKEFGRDILRTEKFLGFEIFTMRSVGNGAGEFGRVQQPTMDGFDKLSRRGAKWAFDPHESGPLKAVFRLKQELDDCVVEEKISVFNTIKRIDCEVFLQDWDGAPYREFRLAIPVNAVGGQVAYEVPMGVVEVGKSEIPGTGGPAYGNLNYDEPCAEIRPREVQNFLSASGADFGVTLTTSVAVNDYLDPTPNPADYPILQPVLLASRRSCHGEGNWYLQEGNHHYRFSLTSHRAGWKNGYRTGIQPNIPLLPVMNPFQADGAKLPEENSFISVSMPNVLVSTIKKCEDDDSVIVRLFDIEGKSDGVEVNSFFPIAGVDLVNLIEEEGRTIPHQNQNLKIEIGHHAIETLKLRFKK